MVQCSDIQCAIQEALDRSVATLQDHVFLWLSKAMAVCPQLVYVELGKLMKRNAEWCDIENVPANLVGGQGKVKLSFV